MENETIQQTNSTPKEKNVNTLFHFASRDIRPEFANTSPQFIKQEQLLIDLTTDIDPTTPIQPASSSTKTTTTIIKKTITSTITTESITTTTSNNRCKHCNQIPTIGRGRLILDFHEKQCSSNKQLNKN